MEVGDLVVGDDVEVGEEVVGDEVGVGQPLSNEGVAVFRLTVCEEANNKVATAFIPPQRDSNDTDGF